MRDFPQITPNNNLMIKKLLFLTVIALCGIATLPSCNKRQGATHEEMVDNTPKIEGIDFYIVPDSLMTPDGLVPNDVPNVGDTVWINKAPSTHTSSPKTYETDPMWREVQRAVDNDPYFKQW